MDPGNADQFFTAAQVKRLGIGEWRQQRFYTVARGARILHSLMHEPRYKRRAQAIAAQLAKEDGVTTLCETIEAVLHHSKK